MLMVFKLCNTSLKRELEASSGLGAPQILTYSSRSGEDKATSSQAPEVAGCACSSSNRRKVGSFRTSGFTVVWFKLKSLLLRLMLHHAAPDRQASRHRRL